MMNDFGRELKRLCKKNGITQKTLAEQLGIVNNTISKWCHDVCVPRKDMVEKVEECLGVKKGTLENLIDRSRKPGGTHYTETTEQRVLKAWNRGESSLEEVVNKTNLPMAVVRTYLPLY